VKKYVKKYVLVGVLVFSLVAFELFNYASTEYSFSTLIGDLQIFGISWSVLMAIAFCGSDFAGIARVFTDKMNKYETYMLLAVWLIASIINMTTTWWGVTSALVANGVPGNEVISHETLIMAVPSIIAFTVFAARISLIGSFSLMFPKT
jgi:hypothetical protein